MLFSFKIGAWRRRACTSKTVPVRVFPDFFLKDHSQNRHIKNAGDIDDNHFFYDSDMYCLEGKELTENDSVVWDVWMCENPKPVEVKVNNYGKAC